MKRKLKVAVVGCGFIARQVHLPLLTHFKNVEVVAVCDAEIERAKRIADDFGVPKFYADLETMLEERNPDLVDICTPPATHVDILRQALNNGYPCMVEKPLTTTTRDADEVIDISRTKHLGLYVLHTYSYLPCFRKARQILADKGFDKITSVDARLFTSLQIERYSESSHWIHNLPGGILNSELAPHLLMLLLEFLGNIKDAKVFTSKLSNLPYVAADELRMILTSSNGIGYLSISFNSSILDLSFDIVGDEGHLSIDNFSSTTVYHKSMTTNTNLSTGQSPFYRGMWAVRDILQRVTCLSSTTMNVLLKRQEVLMDGHRFLMQQCFRSLGGIAEYPVDLWKCREVVRLVEVISENVSDQKRAA